VRACAVGNYEAYVVDIFAVRKNGVSLLLDDFLDSILWCLPFCIISITLGCPALGSPAGKSNLHTPKATQSKETTPSSGHDPRQAGYGADIVRFFAWNVCVLLRRWGVHGVVAASYSCLTILSGFSKLHVDISSGIRCHFPLLPSVMCNIVFWKYYFWKYKLVLYFSFFVIFKNYFETTLHNWNRTCQYIIISTHITHFTYFSFSYSFICIRQLRHID